MHKIAFWVTCPSLFTNFLHYTLSDLQHSERSSSFSKSPEKVLSFLQRSFSASPRTPESRKSHLQSFDNKMKITNDTLVAKVDLTKLHRDIPAETSTIKEYGSFGPQISSKTSAVKFLESSQFRRQRWGRTSVSLLFLLYPS